MSQPQVQISFDKTKPVICKGCGGEIFEQVNFLRIVPALLSPTMRQEIFPVPAFRCCKCKILADMEQKNALKSQ
jgi:hypothetical protein